LGFLHGDYPDRSSDDLKIIPFGPQFSGDRGHLWVVFINADESGPGIVRYGIGMGGFGDGGTVNGGFEREDRSVIVIVVVMIVVMRRIGPEPIVDRRPQKPPILPDFTTGKLAPIGFLLQSGGGEFEIFGEFFEGEDGGLHGDMLDRVALEANYTAIVIQ
jgi:hypothetical protein